MLRDIIPAGARKVVYAIYAFVGVVVGAVQVAYVAAESGQPEWLTIALAVYAFVGTALGATAGSNTPAKQEPRLYLGESAE